jgi:hypothetical protein
VPGWLFSMRPCRSGKMGCRGRLSASQAQSKPSNLDLIIVPRVVLSIKLLVFQKDYLPLVCPHNTTLSLCAIRRLHSLVPVKLKNKCRCSQYGGSTHLTRLRMIQTPRDFMVELGCCGCHRSSVSHPCVRSQGSFQDFGLSPPR